MNLWRQTLAWHSAVLVRAQAIRERVQRTPFGRFARTPLAGRLRIVLAVPAAVGVLALLGQMVGMRVNFTNSLPRGLYFVERAWLASALRDRPLADVRRFELVMVCLPPPIAATGWRRHYLEAAVTCPTGVVPVLKIAVGVPGDTVEAGPTAGPTRLRVNGRAITGCGSALVRDERGAPMTVAAGTYRLRGEVWLCGLSVDSWDSRYYGPVGVASVNGRAFAVWAQGAAWTRLESWEQLFASWE